MASGSESDDEETRRACSGPGHSRPPCAGEVGNLVEPEGRAEVHLLGEPEAHRGGQGPELRVRLPGAPGTPRGESGRAEEGEVRAELQREGPGALAVVAGGTEARRDGRESVPAPRVPARV